MDILKGRKLNPGDRVYQSDCGICEKSFGYIIIPKDNTVSSTNVIVNDGFKQPERFDKIKCLVCHTLYAHAQDLFTKLIYTEVETDED